jgi:GTP diphosphokinase / guanosine-3',5'-bis(diphosphate) 3'-diphosphatase
VAGASNVMVKFSKCCKPVPGEEIIGFVTRGRGVAIHKADCPNVIKEKDEKAKLIKVEWNTDSEMVYPVEVEVEAFDRVGVLHDILEKIAETKTNVSKANIKTKRGSSAILKLIVDVKDINHLSSVMKKVREVGDVYNVSRKIT